MNSDDDTKLYAIVAKELSINRRAEGLWTKAFALENGDERATKARYIRERVDFLKRSRNPGMGQDESASPDTHAVPEVAHQRKAVPPVGATVQIAPWARFFARTIDLGVVTVLVFVAGVAMEMSLPTWSLGPLQAVLLGFLVFGIALLAYEAIALSEFGTTIGKAAFDFASGPNEAGSWIPRALSAELFGCGSAATGVILSSQPRQFSFGGGVTDF